MFVLGINGSPRHQGNSNFLTSLFMEEMQKKGHESEVLSAVRLKINPCIGCGHCETEGVCVFDDDFTRIFLPAVIRADIVVLSPPDDGRKKNPGKIIVKNADP